MKKIFFLMATACAIIACNTDTPTSETKKDSSSATTVSATAFAYPRENASGWETGSDENIKNVLLCLKALENKNVKECVSYFADTTVFELDNFAATFSKDSLATFLQREVDGMKMFKIDMEDYEAVKSKDGKSEFVSLWYKQTWQNQTGKLDSIFCMDDMKMVNGKIVMLNEKVRHYPAK